MARKRAPGGGRKPIGDTARAATFTMRMAEDLRQAIEQEAERNHRTLSEEAGIRLRDSLSMPKQLEDRWGQPHNYALARVINMLAQRVDGSTGATWQDNAFAFEVLRHTIDAVMVQLAPSTWSTDGPFDVPDSVEKSAAALGRHRPDQAEMHRRPEGVASAIALGFLDMLDRYETPPFNRPQNVHYAEEFYRMPRLREVLRRDR